MSIPAPACPQPSRLVMRQFNYCDLCDKYNSECLVFTIPNDHTMGYCVCPDCKEAAKVAMFEYCRTNGIYTFNDKKLEALKAAGFRGPFKVRRTNGTVEDGWQFGVVYGFLMTQMEPQTRKQMMRVFKFGEDLSRMTLVEELCEVNGWDMNAFLQILCND